MNEALLAIVAFRAAAKVYGHTVEFASNHVNDIYSVTLRYGGKLDRQDMEILRVPENGTIAEIMAALDKGMADPRWEGRHHVKLIKRGKLDIYVDMENDPPEIERVLWGSVIVSELYDDLYMGGELLDWVKRELKK